MKRSGLHLSSYIGFEVLVMAMSNIVDPQGLLVRFASKATW